MKAEFRVMSRASGPGGGRREKSDKIRNINDKH
jgi:hypothetical protein